MIKFCAFIALGGVIASALIYAFSQSTVTTAFENSRLSIKTTADYILPDVILSTTIMFVVIGIGVILLTLFVSHKIAGPIFRLERSIKKFGEGNLKTSFETRKKDELKLLSANLNEMAVNIRNKMSEVKDLAGEIKSDDVNEQAKAKLHRLKEKLGEFTV
jgi:methyl-accepting chemotaxis protein